MEKILNEKDYAEKRIENKDIGDNPYITLGILSRYYYHVKGLKPKNIKPLLFGFLELAYPKWAASKSSWTKTVENLTKYAYKYPLFESEGIWITEAEFEKVRGIGDKEKEKLAFTLLCLAKFHNQKKPENNNWVNTSVRDIFKMANISCGKKEKARAIGDLIRSGLIRYAKEISNLNIQVLFVDDQSEKVFQIKDLRDLGSEYLSQIEGGFIRCEKCGKLLLNNKYKNKKYCPECAGYQRVKTRQVVCVDCGKIFTVDSTNRRANRCEDCKRLHIQEYDRKRKANSVF